MLTESALFFLNLCNEYSDIQHAKATSGVSDAWLKEKKAATTAQRRRASTEDSDDGAMAPEATSRAASRPTKKRIISSGAAVVSRAQALPSKQSRKTSAAENVRDKGPVEVQSSCRLSGLEHEDDDEDDDEEWQSVKQSPVKERGVCVSDDVRCCYVCLSTRC
jgi:hypothetical protein